jgi:hypothetical protein
MVSALKETERRLEARTEKLRRDLESARGENKRLESEI